MAYDCPVRGVFQNIKRNTLAIVSHVRRLERSQRLHLPTPKIAIGRADLDAESDHQQ